jgi:phosphoglycerate dehydrogenase-like enzyme
MRAMRIGLCFDRLLCDDTTIMRQLAGHEVHDLRDFRARPAEELSGRIRACEVLITGKHTPTLSVELAADPGALRWICHTRGVVKGYFPRVLLERGILLTNWGDAPARGVAQLAFAMLLAQILRLPAMDRRTRRQPAQLPWSAFPGDLQGFRVGLYGCGGIGAAMARLCQGVGMRVAVFDPWAESLPEGVERVATLEELCAGSWAVSVHCGLGPSTENSLDARRLALLPDGAVVVNTARGRVIDETALAAEVAKGRLVAACDVIADESDWTRSPLAAHAEVLLTGHGAHRPQRPAGVAETPWVLPDYVLENLTAYADGRPLRFAIDLARYDRTT